LPVFGCRFGGRLLSPAGQGTPDNAQDHFHDEVEFAEQALAQTVVKLPVGLGHFLPQELLVAVQVGGCAVLPVEGSERGAGEEGAVNVSGLIVFTDNTRHGWFLWLDKIKVSGLWFPVSGKKLEKSGQDMKVSRLARWASIIEISALTVLTDFWDKLLLQNWKNDQNRWGECHRNSSEFWVEKTGLGEKEDRGHRRQSGLRWWESVVLKRWGNGVVFFARQIQAGGEGYAEWKGTGGLSLDRLSLISGI
jgi:hypothetical protein